MNVPEMTHSAAAAAESFRQPPSDFDRLLQRPFTPRDLLEDNNFDKIWRMAEALANSALSIPKELKGNIGDCMAVVTQAMIWGLNPFSVAQKAHVINGKLGYEAQLVNAVVMNSGAIRGSFHYEFGGEGNSLECRVGAVLRNEGEIRWGEWLASATVQVKNSPLWKVNPKQQLGYLQVKNWARAFAPGAILGIYSADELDDNEGDAAGATVSAAPPAPRGPQRKSASVAPAPADVDPKTGEVEPPAAGAPAAPAATIKAPALASTDARGQISTGQANYLRNKLKAAGMTEAAQCERYKVEKLEALNVEAFDELKAELLAMA